MGLCSLRQLVPQRGVPLSDSQWRAAECDEPPAHLSDSMFLLVPRPGARGQGKGQGPGSDNLEQPVGTTQAQGPAAPAWARAALRIAQPPCLGLGTGALPWEAPGRGAPRFQGSAGHLGAKPLPGGEGELGDHGPQGARGQSLAWPGTTQPGLRGPDFRPPFRSPDSPAPRLRPQPVGATTEHLLAPAGGAADWRPPRARRTGPRSEVAPLVTAPAPHSGGSLRTQGAQPRAAENAAGAPPDGAPPSRPAHVRGRGPDPRGSRAACAGEPRATQPAGPLLPVALPGRREGCRKDGAVALAGRGPARDPRGAVKAPQRGDARSRGPLGDSRVSTPPESSGQPRGDNCARALSAGVALTACRASLGRLKRADRRWGQDSAGATPLARTAPALPPPLSRPVRRGQARSNTARRLSGRNRGKSVVSPPGKRFGGYPFGWVGWSLPPLG
jgi:hypothetical protein